MKDIQAIGVIGAGAMGAGIAQVAASSGHPVWVYDVTDTALDRAKSNLEKTLNRLIEKGRMTMEQAGHIQQNIQWTNSLENLSQSDLVIEAVIENLRVKKQVFADLEAIVHPDCVLASNTSSLSIASIASALKHQERMIGIHFFNPAPLMPLVEIIPSITSKPELAPKIAAFIQSWGKVTVIAKDTPGFIVNRVARPFYSEALKIYEEGLASFATIDHALKTVGGFRMGPFELMDLIGHDVNYVVTETVWTQFYYDPRFKPAITQKRLLEAGWLGRKAGRGFYDYREGAVLNETDPSQELAAEIFERVFVLLVNEAADALFLKIAAAKDIDLAMTKGVNYPKGLLQWGMDWGLDRVLSRLEKQQAWYGDDRYRPNPLLRHCVKQNIGFFDI
jgi:3-hydroxybutyryl-CoA dehydrogenase